MSRTALVLALLLAVIVSARFIDAQTQPVAGLTSVAISAGTTGPPSLFPSGTAARPGISFAADPTTGLYLFSAGNLVGDTGGANVYLLNTSGFAMISTGLYRWTGGDALQSVDTGLGRNAAGVVEVNTGTAGGVASLTTNNSGVQGGALILGGASFSTLNAALVKGTIMYCVDCTIANPCAAGGTGAIAKKLNGVLVCN